MCRHPRLIRSRRTSSSALATAVVISAGLLCLAPPGVALGLDRQTILISAPTGRDAGFPSGLPESQSFDLSDDGKRVAIETWEQLVPEDIDASSDVYERVGGVTRLASAPQPGAPGPDGVSYNEIVAGDHIYFQSTAGLVPGDTDGGVLDVYEFSGGVVRLVSEPAPGATGAESIDLVGASPDGTAVFSESKDHVTSEDGDCIGGRQCVDVYEHSGGTTRLVSAPGPGATGPSWPARYAGSSQDGGRVFFSTKQSLTSEDADADCPTPPVAPDEPAGSGCGDLYERSGEQTRLVSTPEGGPTVLASGDTGFGGISDDGAHVFFTSPDHLAPGDGAGLDVFERFNGRTILVSAPAPGGDGDDAGFVAVGGNSADGSRVFFHTGDGLAPEDDDGGYSDVYERSGGTTKLVSTGPSSMTGEGFAFFEGTSEDGSRVFFETNEQLTADDLNSDNDIYARSADGTSLASGPTSADDPSPEVFYQGNSEDGLRMFFETPRRLDPADADSDEDIYENAEGQIALMSGPGLGASGGSEDVLRVHQAVSESGDRVFWITSERLVGADTDDRPDVYGAIPASDVPPSDVPPSQVPPPGAGGGGGAGGVAGGVATNFRNVEVHKLVVPKSRQKLAARGVKVLASCDEDCRIVLELRVSQEIANEMGLTGTLLARASKPADAGERRWVRAKPTGAARRALRSYDGGGRLQVDVTGAAR